MSQDTLCFYSKSKDVYPGRGAGESVANPEDYKELSQIDDWRKILSNFHICQFDYDYYTYNTIEHAYHAEKFRRIKFLDEKNQDAYDQIAFNLTVDSGSKLGLGDGNDARKIRKFIIMSDKQKEYWDSISRDVMKNISISKYSRSVVSRKVLKLTNDAKLLHIVSRSPVKDRFTWLEDIRKTL